MAGDYGELGRKYSVHLVASTSFAPANALTSLIIGCLHSATQAQVEQISVMIPIANRAGLRANGPYLLVTKDFVLNFLAGQLRLRSNTTTAKFHWPRLRSSARNTYLGS